MDDTTSCTMKVMLTLREDVLGSRLGCSSGKLTLWHRLSTPDLGTAVGPGFHLLTENTGKNSAPRLCHSLILLEELKTCSLLLLLFFSEDGLCRRRRGIQGK